MHLDTGKGAGWAFGLALAREAAARMEGRRRTFRGHRLAASAVARAVPFCLCVLALVSCASKSVVVQTVVPDPVVDPLPIAVGIHYDPELSQYRYDGKIPVTSIRWSIDLGAEQANVFNKIMRAMFARVEIVPSLEEIPEDTDLSAILHPVMKDFQFATPRQNLGDFFEAWLEYDIRLLGTDGALIANWPLTAYGKVEDGLFGTASAGVHQAISEALRDVVAVFIFDFSRDPRVQKWLDDLQTGRSLGSTAAETLVDDQL